MGCHVTKLWPPVQIRLGSSEPWVVTKTSVRFSSGRRLVFVSLAHLNRVLAWMQMHGVSHPPTNTYSRDLKRCSLSSYSTLMLDWWHGPTVRVKNLCLFHWELCSPLFIWFRMRQQFRFPSLLQTCAVNKKQEHYTDPPCSLLNSLLSSNAGKKWFPLCLSWAQSLM